MRWPASPRLRTGEILLLLLASGVSLCGVSAVALALNGTPTLGWLDLRLAVAVAACSLAVSLAWGLIGFRGDSLILPLAVVLGAIGLVTMTRLTPPVADRGEALDVASRQATYLCVGLLVAAVVAVVDPIWPLLRRYKYTLLIVGIGLLAATFVFGTSIGGARIWIQAGPILIQPSEPIKILLVLFLAAYLDEKRDLVLAGWRVGPLTLPAIPYLIPMALMAGTSVLVLVIENDLGSALMLFAAFLVMLYTATNKVSFLVTGFAGFALAAWLAYSLFDRVGVRIENWLDPWQDPYVLGYQQIQSDYALSSAGLLGSGLGQGQPWRIPVVQTDYVLSAIGEEVGIAGTIAVLVLVALLVLRGFRIALASDDFYTQLVAVGLAATLGIQTVVIVAGVLRMLPLTGITLPFVSYGGSSLLTNFVLLGLLANVSARRLADR